MDPTTLGDKRHILGLPAVDESILSLDGSFHIHETGAIGYMQRGGLSPSRPPSVVLFVSFGKYKFFSLDLVASFH